MPLIVLRARLRVLRQAMRGLVGAGPGSDGFSGRCFDSTSLSPDSSGTAVTSDNSPSRHLIGHKATPSVWWSPVAEGVCCSLDARLLRPRYVGGWPDGRSLYRTTVGVWGCPRLSDSAAGSRRTGACEIGVIPQWTLCVERLSLDHSPSNLRTRSRSPLLAASTASDSITSQSTALAVPPIASPNSSAVVCPTLLTEVWGRSSWVLGDWLRFRAGQPHVFDEHGGSVCQSRCQSEHY